jgi:hypothetical protein
MNASAAPHPICLPLIYRAALALSILVVSGCVPLAPLVYMPAKVASQSIPGRMCEPAYKTSIFQNDGLTVALVLSPRSDVLLGSVQLDVPSGTSFQMKASSMTIDAMSFQAPIQAKMAAGRFAAEEKINGYALAEFSFAAKLPSSPEELTVALPRFEINGTVVEPKPILLALRRQPMLVGICQ